MKLKTHLKINSECSGEVVKLQEDYAEVLLVTNEKMLADEFGLVHGGFTFSAADFAAMAAINEENVVLTASECRFLAPVVLGDEVIFEAKVIKKDMPKAVVNVVAKVKDKEVFQGEFKTYTLKEHILKKQ